MLHYICKKAFNSLTGAVVDGDILSKFDLLKMGKFKCRTMGKSFDFIANLQQFLILCLQIQNHLELMYVPT